MSIPLRSNVTTQGRRMAGARALWRANGMTEEQMGKPVIAVVNSFTQMVPGHVHLHEVGQLVKLDPTKPKNPLVWSVFDNDRLPSGIWATPALHRDLVIVGTDGGRLLFVDRATGEIRWELASSNTLWPSPVIVDDVLLQADCNGTLWAFDVSDTQREPQQLWSVNLGACIESTPAVWDGRIIVGTRGGQVHMLAD